MHTDRCGKTRRQKCCAKGSGKEAKIQEFMYRDTANVEPEMYDCTSNNWSHWNCNRRCKEKFGRHARKIFDRFRRNAGEKRPVTADNNNNNNNNNNNIETKNVTSATISQYK